MRSASWTTQHSQWPVVATTACARCGTGGLSGKITPSLLESWQATLTESHSSTQRGTGDTLSATARTRQSNCGTSGSSRQVLQSDKAEGKFLDNDGITDGRGCPGVWPVAVAEWTVTQAW